MQCHYFQRNLNLMPTQISCAMPICDWRTISDTFNMWRSIKICGQPVAKESVALDGLQCSSYHL